VHLYKLLCGVTFDLSLSSIDLLLRAFLWQETGKTLMKQCDGIFAGDAPVHYGVLPTSAAGGGPSAGGRGA